MINSISGSRFLLIEANNSVTANNAFLDTPDQRD